MTLNTRPSTSTFTWRYTGTAIALHWGIALLIAFIAALGWYMMSIEDEPGSGWYFNLHKSLGIVMALLVAVRIGWRSLNRPEPLSTAIPKWQRQLSQATQGLLYLLMVLVPFAGYIGASYTKKGVLWFGLATPHWAVPDHDRAEQFFDIHSVLVWVLVVLVALHVLGALKHLLIDHDGVFQRMLFKRRR
jgi:cytochrome b561